MGPGPYLSQVVPRVHPVESPPVGHAERTEDRMIKDGRARAERAGHVLEPLIQQHQVRLDDDGEFEERPPLWHGGFR